MYVNNINIKYPSKVWGRYIFFIEINIFIQQGYIKLNNYQKTKYYFKEMLFFWTFYSSKNPWKTLMVQIRQFSQKY